MLAGSGIARGKNDVDSTVGQQFGRNVHGIVDVKDGVSRETTVHYANIQAVAICQKIVESFQNEEQR